MSLYDRDYYQEDPQPSKSFFTGLSGVWLIILINVVLFFANSATQNALFEAMALDGTKTSDPLQWYRVLTFGFAHDPSGFGHIFGNMLALFFLGRAVEMKYGKAEFLALYLASVIFGGVVWSIVHFGQNTGALGASGAVTTVVILFAINYPKTIIYIWGVIPIPAWLLGVLYVLYDAFAGNDGIAHDVHLSGAAFAGIYFFLYHVLGVRFTKFASGAGKKRARRSTTTRPTYDLNARRDATITVAPKESKRRDEKGARLDAKVDEILRKISESGEESLTELERETLRFASREYQKRKNGR